MSCLQPAAVYRHRSCRAHGTELFAVESGETHGYGFCPHSIRRNSKTLLPPKLPHAASSPRRAWQTSAWHQLNPAVIGHHPAFICSESIRAIKVAGHFVPNTTVNSLALEGGSV